MYQLSYIYLLGSIGNNWANQCECEGVFSYAPVTSGNHRRWLTDCERTKPTRITPHMPP